MSLEVKTKTTGFGSPAESYVESRLDLNQLIVEDVFTTYYFRWQGEDKHNIKTNDVLVVDRAAIPKKGDVILIEKEEKLELELFNNQKDSIWGIITWTLSQIKK